MPPENKRKAGAAGLSASPEEPPAARPKKGKRAGIRAFFAKRPPRGEVSSDDDDLDLALSEGEEEEPYQCFDYDNIDYTVDKSANRWADKPDDRSIAEHRELTSNLFGFTGFTPPDNYRYPTEAKGPYENMTPAYVAGMFSADGGVFPQVNDTGVLLRVKHTSYKMLCAAKECIGVGTITPNRASWDRQKATKPSWQLQCGGRHDVIKWYKAMKPFMKFMPEKQEQLRLVMAVYKGEIASFADIKADLTALKHQSFSLDGRVLDEDGVPVEAEAEPIDLKFDLENDDHAAYVAGFMDGDGCFSGDVARVTCTTPFILHVMTNSFAGSALRKHEHAAGTGDNWRKSFTWSIERAAPLIKFDEWVLPHLLIKRDVVRQQISRLETKKRHLRAEDIDLDNYLYPKVMEEGHRFRVLQWIDIEERYSYESFTYTVGDEEDRRRAFEEAVEAAKITEEAVANGAPTHGAWKSTHGKATKVDLESLTHEYIHDKGDRFEAQFYDEKTGVYTRNSSGSYNYDADDDESKENAFLAILQDFQPTYKLIKTNAIKSYAAWAEERRNNKEKTPYRCVPITADSTHQITFQKNVHHCEGKSAMRAQYWDAKAKSYSVKHFPFKRGSSKGKEKAEAAAKEFMKETHELMRRGAIPTFAKFNELRKEGKATKSDSKEVKINHEKLTATLVYKQGNTYRAHEWNPETKKYDVRLFKFGPSRQSEKEQLMRAVELLEKTTYPLYRANRLPPVNKAKKVK